jgi:hypothetical protein
MSSCYQILDVETEVGKKPVQFFTTAALEFYLGFRGRYINRLISEGKLPKTPYVKTGGFGRQIALYTKEMLSELVDLYDLHYPATSLSKNPQKRLEYGEKLAEYIGMVRKLEEKWRTTDYLTLAEVPPNWWKKRNKGI